MKIRWAIDSILGIGLLLCLAAGVVLCENSLRVPKRAMRDTSFPGVSRRDLQITARDGAVLRAWLFTPAQSNGNVLIALHGISDSRAGVMGLTRLFVENHYAVLAPDSRGHGRSGGDVVTYGLREADDLHRWVDWLMATERPRNVFEMGESLGAAVLLQSLAGERRFSAVVAECPFANFERVAVDRVAQRIPGPAFVRNEALDGISTPVLLIHGLADTNIYPYHSQTLAARNPKYTTLVAGTRGAAHRSVWRRARGVSTACSRLVFRE